VLRVHLDVTEHLDLTANLDFQEAKAMLAFPVHPVFLEPQEKTAFRAHPDCEAIRASLDCQAYPASAETTATMERRENRAIPEFLDHQDLRDPKEWLARPVFLD
jgi:hypothetical protein